ncbi:polymorphic toxin type 50 domain-containing protein [Campylobacter concisus]|uniref:polymorphic toxin type 50 domain-containing protein n=1 Tax=Campylobacter concisus TaxID=199 RepID=UPI00142E987F
MAGSKERIDFGKVIGYYIDENGNKLSTTKGIVHYGKMVPILFRVVQIDKGFV